MKRARPAPKEVAVTSKYFGGTSSSYFGGAHAPFKVSLPPTISVSPQPATLLLGSQASDTAMARIEAFASNENAFWHIIGCALHIQEIAAILPFLPFFIFSNQALFNSQQQRRAWLCSWLPPQRARAAGRIDRTAPAARRQRRRLPLRHHERG